MYELSNSIVILAKCKGELDKTKAGKRPILLRKIGLFPVIFISLYQ